MRWLIPFALLAALTPLRADAQLRVRTIDAYADAPIRRLRVRAAPPGLTIAGRDDRRGVPTLLLGRVPLGRANLTRPIARATHHLGQIARLYGVSATDLASLEVTHTMATPSGGALVIFGQRVRGVPVFETRLSLLLDVDGALIAAGGQLRPTFGAGPFHGDHTEAARRTLAAHFGPGAASSPLTLTETRADGSRYFTTDPTSSHAVDRDVRALQVFFPLPRRLVPAHYVELWADGELFAYVISAEDGQVLMRRSLTVDEAFEYQVYVDPDHPLLQAQDSPFGDTSPDPLYMPVATVPAFVPQSRILVEGLNRNPLREPDPWLPAGATETVGNNVDAYADLVAPDGRDDGDPRASVTSPGVFAHAYDGARSPAADGTQRQAAITHLFYVTNWLHDYFYGLGFDESAGNAQASNLGRGGEEDDVLRAEAMDYARRNNASMSTPRDGSSPRMQMFLWDGWEAAGLDAEGATYEVGIARFGPLNFDIVADTVVVDDGVGTASDACEAISADLTGRIALIDRGDCSFITKVERAEAAGAVGVVIMNRDPGLRPSNMSGRGVAVGIPSLRVSFEVGEILRSAAGSARLRRMARHDAPSSLDTTVVAHEWGHYLHRRLLTCGSPQCKAQSEGWGDFLGLFVTMEPEDDLRAIYPTAGFSNQGSAATYFGTRRVPFSTDRAFNDLSFRHIADGEPLPDRHPLEPSPLPNSQSHNAGEVWATMMFEALVSMLERSREPSPPYSFEDARRRMARYLVLGMQLAPRAPTFTEQRDTLIAAALESDLEDARRIAIAFASRGAGTCAISPPRFSTDLIGVVEDFEAGPRPVIEALSVELGGARRLCDTDAFLDAGERGWVRVLIRNHGVAPMLGATLSIEPGDLALSATPTTVALPELGPGRSTEQWVEIAADEAGVAGGPVSIRASVDGPTVCASVSRETRVLVDRDPAPSLVERFEIEPSWLDEVGLEDGVVTAAGTTVFSVGASALGDEDWVLRGADSRGLSDTALLLPPVSPQAGVPFVLSFEHRFDFEADEDTLWDGGVIELSTDGGETWRDVEERLDPGYTGVLATRARNPLGARRAYSGHNPSFPDADTVRLDFGTSLAGERVQIRFRIATNVSVGAAGWEIDELRFAGVDPPPFPGYATDATECSGTPSADAGPDQEIQAGDRVTLDGTGSSDPDGDALTYTWEVRLPHPWLLLSDPASATPGFSTPIGAGDQQIVLRLNVSDDRGGSASDDVVIHISARGPSAVPDAGAPRDAEAWIVDAAVDGGLGPLVPMGGGCSCGIAPRSTRGWGWLLGWLAVALGVRRRDGGG